MQRLDKILEVYVAKPDDDGMNDMIAGAAFIVVDKNGKTSSSPSLATRRRD